MIDHITATTGQEKIFYIGHSMGTTGFMVMANERPDMQEKIHMANLLAPVAYVDHMKSPIRYLAPFSTEIAVKLFFIHIKKLSKISTVVSDFFISKLSCFEMELNFSIKSVLFS